METIAPNTPVTFSTTKAKYKKNNDNKNTDIILLFVITKKDLQNK